jgi:D-amino peptidase
MTREALAAVEAAKRPARTEIIVADSHGNGENLLIEQFPADVRDHPLVAAAARDDGRHRRPRWTRPSSSATTPGPTTRPASAPTRSRAPTSTRVALNGTNVTEGSWNAAIAGHFGVPVVMMSGDDAAIAEVRGRWATSRRPRPSGRLGFHSANTLTPPAAAALIGERVRPR